MTLFLPGQVIVLAERRDGTFSPSFSFSFYGGPELSIFFHRSLVLFYLSFRDRSPPKSCFVLVDRTSKSGILRSCCISPSYLSANWTPSLSLVLFLAIQVVFCKDTHKFFLTRIPFLPYHLAPCLQGLLLGQSLRDGQVRFCLSLNVSRPLYGELLFRIGSFQHLPFLKAQE